HGLFDDAVMREDIGLPFRRGRAVAAHRRKDEWPHTLRAPVVGDCARDGGDVCNAPAAHSDGNARAGLQAGSKCCRGKLSLNGARDTVHTAVGKVLADQEQAGIRHGSIIQATPLRFRQASYAWAFCGRTSARWVWWRAPCPPARGRWRELRA